MGFKGENICIMGKIRPVLLCYPSLTPLSCQWPSGTLFNSQHALGLEVHAWVLTNRHSQRSFSLCLRYILLRHVCVSPLQLPKHPAGTNKKRIQTPASSWILFISLQYVYMLVNVHGHSSILGFFFFLLMWVRCTGIQGRASMWLKNKLFGILISF